MAVFYQLFSPINRGTFTCAMATAAYRSGTHLKIAVFDKKSRKKTDYSFDYSQKKGIAFSAILAPKSAPPWVFNRQLLWQAVEDREKKFNALLAWEYTIALPEELTAQQNSELAKEFAETSFVARGMIVDVNLHNEHSNNPHLHLLCPTRVLNTSKEEDGPFQERSKEWGRTAFKNKLRQEQAQIINKYLEKYGHSSRVSSLPDSTNRYHCLRPWL